MSKFHPKDIHTANQGCAYVPSSCDDDNGFLGAVTSETLQQNPSVVTIQLHSVPVEFHIDTGAEVTVITEALYHKVGSSSLIAPDQALKGAKTNLKSMFVDHFHYTVILILISPAMLLDLAKPLLGVQS